VGGDEPTARRHRRKVYLKDNDIASIDEREVDFDPDIAAGALDTSGGVTPYAIDPGSARRLWDLSEKMLA
jgi:hypothetical protein